MRRQKAARLQDVSKHISDIKDINRDFSVRRKIKKGDKMAAARAFKMWVYSNHKFVQGLANRRADEVRLFLQSGQADIAALLLGAMMAGAAVLVAMIFVM